MHLILTVFLSIKGIYLPYSKIRKLQLTNTLERYVRELRESKINAVVVDAKNVRGELFLRVEHPLLTINENTIKTDYLKNILEVLRRSKLYTIVRIVAFKDSLMAPFVENHYGIWISPEDEIYKDYLLTILDSVLSLRPNEIQWDYVRWPDVTDYPEVEVPLEERCRAIEDFLSLAATKAHGAYVFTSVDVFGRTCFASHEGCNDSIGQSVSGMSLFCDYISPMIYPSHYKKSMRKDPYMTVRETILNCLFHLDGEADKLRPYLQAFDYRVPKSMGLKKYIEEELRFFKNEDFKVNGFLFWNPGGNYEVLFKVLKNYSD